MWIARKKSCKATKQTGENQGEKPTEAGGGWLERSKQVRFFF